MFLTAEGAPPSSFDLRNVNGTNFVTSVKHQQGGTCWTHGAMAAVEGNLLMSGHWTDIGGAGNPNLAEYHLDWWNGFNTYNNDDTNPPPSGLTIHLGGDYLVTAAYMSRGEGAVYCADANDGTENDDNWYDSAPARAANNYQFFYPRHVQWHMAGPGLTNIDAIKQAIISNGVIGTCMYYSSGLYNSGYDAHYQPATDTRDPNHAIAIVGWDDNKSTQAPNSGAWLCKNSWGSGWSGDGYFWISYYDKHCGQHPEMGAVVFKDVVECRYQTIYSHDYHGWRDTMFAQSGFNAFIIQTNQLLDAVSFYTTARNVAYTATLYAGFDGTNLHQELHSQTGTFSEVGYHTVDLEPGVSVTNGQRLYIRVDVSGGGMAYDRTSEIAVLLDQKPLTRDPGPEQQDFFNNYLNEMGKGSGYGQDGGTVVPSTAAAGESYYFNGTNWIDFITYTNTGNLCIKGLARSDHDMDGLADDDDLDDDNDGIPDVWEERYGQDPLNADDAHDDGDEDGADNLEEYIAGTAPTNKTSRFEITSVDSRSAATEFVLQWPCASNRVYSVERSADLIAGAWECIASNMTPVLPDNVYTDKPPVIEGTLYYRVNVRIDSSDP